MNRFSLFDINCTQTVCILIMATLYKRCADIVLCSSLVVVSLSLCCAILPRSVHGTPLLVIASVVYTTVPSSVVPSLQALRKLEDIRLKDEAEEDQWKAILLKLYLNLALCSHKQRKPKLVITNCRKALEFDPSNVKAFFRLGQVIKSLPFWTRLSTVDLSSFCILYPFP